MPRSNRRDGDHRRPAGPYRGTFFGSTAPLAALLLLVLGFAAGCGGGEASGGGEGEAAAPEEETVGSDEASPDEATAEGVSPEEIASGETSIGGSGEDEGLTPAGATVGPEEETAMPAGGREEDPSQNPPGNPPEGVRTFPATTNKNLQPPISYEQDPPANGDHAPYWQNCGFYSEPVETEAAVHTMDHGAVWLTFRPDLLTPEQINTLRGYGQEEYVLVSPYPNQAEPVVATAWRNQLRLEGADDPRLRQFVDQFRISETAPRSGNGCTGGVGG